MKESFYKHRILVLDFGSQYAPLIVRRVRELNIYCELKRWDATEKQIRDFNPSGIILSGSPKSATEDGSPRASQYIFEAGIPILGICYGMQTMAVQFGGQVKASGKREFGYMQVEVNVDNILTRGIKNSLTIDGKPLLDVWMSHGDQVTVIPPNFIAVASTKTCPFAIIANEEKKLYGVQFHPEVSHTVKGINILKRFVYEICGCKTFRNSVKISDNIVKYIQRRVGNDKVILAFSGGVDSTVAAILIHRAIGNNLTCVFVNNGLLHLSETQQVVNIFRSNFDLNIIHVCAEERFLTALKGEKNPEIKRQIVGRVFIEVFEEVASGLKDIKWLAQGTIYPDVIESAAVVTSKAHIIKSHHNVGGLPGKMKMKLIEPLRTLFKDEVRKIGLELGLPYEVVYRHPFPGPGLSIRILGEVKREYCDLLRQTDAIFIEELKIANLYDRLSQAFSVFLPVRSVSVMGDDRKYDWVISLRAVETNDFMTANWARLPYDFMSHVSNRIINEVNGISRVIYDISSKPPATIEWE